MGCENFRFVKFRRTVSIIVANFVIKYYRLWAIEVIVKVWFQPHYILREQLHGELLSDNVNVQLIQMLFNELCEFSIELLPRVYF